MKTSLTRYGLMAEKHWRQFLPRMTARLESRGEMTEMLREAEEMTEAGMDSIRSRLINQGMTPRQAEDAAWEMIRERYIFLPPES
jgi:hypothetical protein